jgi:hypothetical protein
MNSKSTNFILYIAAISISLIFPALTQAQMTQISFTLKNRATVSDLSALGGAVTDKNVARIGIFIGKAESDEEWDGKGRWVTGPTGRWLTTSLRSDRTWTPAFALPDGGRLPNGAYNIIAVGFDGSGRAMTAQYRLTVNVSR